MPDNQFDDEEVVVKKSSTPPPATNNADLDADFQDLDVTHTGDGLDRIVPANKDSKVRCAVLTHVVKSKMAAVHFIQKPGEEKKSVYRYRPRSQACTGCALADCCKKLNNDENQRAQLVFATLAVRYTDADSTTGKYSKPAEGQEPVAPKWELGWLKLSRAGFKAIRELVMEGESETDFDFAMGYQANKVAYSYSRVSKNAPRYKLFPEVEKAILEDAQKYADGVILVNRLGKVISELDMKALLAGKSAAAAAKNGKIDDTSDLD